MALMSAPPLGGPVYVGGVGHLRFTEQTLMMFLGDSCLHVNIEPAAAHVSGFHPLTVASRSLASVAIFHVALFAVVLGSFLIVAFGGEGLSMLLAGRRSSQRVRRLTISEDTIFSDPQPSMVFDHFGVVLIEPRDGGE
jgi:hypothetical protein